ncbi:MAG: glycosyltransferase family 92 protein [Elusimicrobiota bacterium]|jgi:hypothetical protein|nr:glycosyltransferase family 92 protein [Elusimicrobiota bacterium]
MFVRFALKIWNGLVLFFTSFIPIKKVRRKARKKFLQLQFHIKKYAHENNNNFENYLSVLACAKNEGPYLKEWIAYHKMLGVEKFYIFDNDSSDNTFEILQPYINSGLAVYEKFSYTGDIWPQPQRDIYTKAVKKYKNKTKWMAVIDIDEFIVPLRHESIRDFLQDYEKFSQITMHYKFFGSCGHISKPQGLVIENYEYARISQDNTVDSVVNDNTGKSIINPRAAFGKIFEHYSQVIGMPVDERKLPYLEDPSVIGATTDIIQVNHYWAKSQEECLKRGLRNVDKLRRFNESQNILDTAIKRFIPTLKKNMGLN